MPPIKDVPLVVALNRGECMQREAIKPWAETQSHLPHAFLHSLPIDIDTNSRPNTSLEQHAMKKTWDHSASILIP